MNLKDVHKHWRTTFERIEKFISKEYFSDANLLARLVIDQLEAIKIQHLTNQDFEGPWLDKSLQEAHNLWKDVEIGFYFGPVWSVHWFRVQLPRPTSWPPGADTSVHFQWNSGTEVLIFEPSGRILQGVTSLHEGTRETAELLPGDTFLADNGAGGVFTLYLQCSVSELFGAGPSCVKPPDPLRRGQLAACRLVRRDTKVARLLEDLRLLMEIAKELKEVEQGHRALYSANSAINLCLQERYSDALAVTDGFFKSSVGCPTRMQLHAMGHCHIDTAWLWNYAETRRKIARSWSSTLRLMRQDPSMTFVVSQAQQLSWLQADYPDLFAEIVQLASQNRFIPVGGSWVEMDTNLPCAESLLRQFHYGQAYFERHFGRRCPEFWLPDTFGYSGQLPQLMRHAGMRWFLTQKLSWSLVNKFPHHSFLWRGIDGSEVLAHFPPGDSYCMQVRPSELAFSASNHRDKGRASHAAFLYGHGDGGQGPGPDMLVRLGRLADCDGLPRLAHGSPETLFVGLEAELRHLHSWTGELYLELHNGTYTTHRGIKLANQRCEAALRVAEFLLAVAALRGPPLAAETRASLDTAWKLLLLNQFHDVIPGSSIGRVYVDAMTHYGQVMTFCRDICRPGQREQLQSPSLEALVNPTQWPLKLLVGGNRLVELAPFSISRLDRLEFIDASMQSGVLVSQDGSGCVLLENEHLRARVDPAGRVVSLIAKKLLDRECLSGPVQLTFYHDVPLFWDAWDIMDYSWETRAELAAGDSSSDGCKGMGRLVEQCRPTGSFGCAAVYELTSYPIQGDAARQPLVSRIEQQVAILPDRPHCLTFTTRVRPWRAAHTLLRVELPCAVRGVSRAACEIQAGRVDRPTRGNTSWDWAAHEHCSHRYLDLSEAGFGLAVLKQAIYGASVRDGGVVHLSLLRSPRGPDPDADFGAEHCLRYALMPHAGLAGLAGDSTCDGLTRSACQFAYQCEPDLVETDSGECAESALPRIEIDQSGSQSLVIDWVKPAADNNNQPNASPPAPADALFLLRLYESVGGHVPACRLRIRLDSPAVGSDPVIRAFESNALEERLRPLRVTVEANGPTAVALVDLPTPVTAYQILSVLVCRDT